MMNESHVFAPLVWCGGRIGTPARPINAVPGLGCALAVHHGMAISLEGHPTTGDNLDRFFDTAIGQGERLVGFGGHRVDGADDLGILEGQRRQSVTAYGVGGEGGRQS